MEKNNFKRQWMRQKTNPGGPPIIFLVFRMFALCYTLLLSLKPHPVTVKGAPVIKALCVRKITPYTHTHTHSHTYADPINNYITDTLVLMCGLLE